MNYKNIKEARFLSRPNRFIANIEIEKEIALCHVKNTGRCKELLIEGTKIYVQEFDTSSRKTKYDLINVIKGNRMINMDSQVPNKVFREWVEKGNLFEDVVSIKPECTYGNSRFDFYIETKTAKIFVEVKGVTLEEDGVVLFPDAPTERGIKHVKELCQCLTEGYEAFIVFIIQMKGVAYFTPNWKTQAAFGEALKSAQEQGVQILAMDCDVTEDSIKARDLVEVRI